MPPRAPGGVAPRPGQLDHAAGHGALLDIGAAGDLLQHPPIAIAGGEVLLRVDAGRVFAQDRLDPVVPLEEFVQSIAESTRRLITQLAHRDLVHRLAAVLPAEHLVGVGPEPVELGLDLVQRGGGDGPLSRKS